MATITGFIEKIKFRNEENGYTVLSVTDQSDGDEVIMVGTLSYAAEGDMIQASGRMIEHPVYGEQLQIESYEMKTPQDAESMERYLGSGAIKGIGAALAARIVRHFKADTFRVMEEEPERLSEVKGISEKMAMAIAEQVEEKKGMREAMMFLQNYGITLNLAAKIYQEYGPKLYSIIKENPYKLADDIPGVGFKMADEIAEKVGIFTDSDYRIRAGLLYILLQASANGHTYLPQKELFSQAAELLKVEPTAMEKHLMDMQIDRKVVVKTVPGSEPPEYLVYSSHYYYLELNTARMLHDLNIRGDIPETEIRANLAKVQKKEEIHLDELQEKAVFEAVNSGLLVITGGPGTGKTTVVKGILNVLEQAGCRILLAAPTGRAARRLADSAGHPAATVHRLLEYQPTGDGLCFGKDDSDPLDAEAIIIDEASMLDITLTYHLLKAIPGGCRLIFVGDVDQLPSVGAGSVLKDMIRSGRMPVVRLENVFRQAEVSPIVRNAHKINRGQMPEFLAGADSEFALEEFANEQDAAEFVARTYAQLTSGGDWRRVQVLTPMHKNPCGVQNLNKLLQKYLNPPSAAKPEVNIPGNVLRVGDKVMQIRNNYEKDVFNGDIGRVIKIDGKNVTVAFPERPEGDYVTYAQGEVEELQLAYAMSVHKSQGSEYPYVILIMVQSHYIMLQRNLLYTAVTRAKEKVLIVGSKNAVRTAVENDKTKRRYSLLAERLQESSEVF